VVGVDALDIAQAVAEVAQAQPIGHRDDQGHLRQDLNNAAQESHRILQVLQYIGQQHMGGGKSHGQIGKLG
jgi:hypothetical protein